METAVAIGAAVFGGIVARSWYMAIALGTIAGAIARFAYVWVRTGSLTRTEFDAAIVGTLLGSAITAVLVHVLLRWRRAS